MTPARFTAKYERDTRGMWIVELTQDTAVHTYGRRLEVARAAMHEAVARWAQLRPEQFELIDEIVLPPAARTSIDAAVQRREEADRAREDAIELSRTAAHYLVNDLGFTVRDTADLLNVSPSRISQLLRSTGP